MGCRIAVLREGIYGKRIVSLGRSSETESVRAVLRQPDVGLVMLAVPEDFLG